MRKKFSGFARAETAVATNLHTTQNLRVAPLPSFYCRVLKSQKTNVANRLETSASPLKRGAEAREEGKRAGKRQRRKENTIEITMNICMKMLKGSLPKCQMKKRAKLVSQTYRKRNGKCQISPWHCLSSTEHDARL